MEMHDRGIEALEMAYLENATRVRCESREIVGLDERRSHRFFEKNVDATLQHRRGDFVMGDTGRGDGHEIDIAAQ